jgi:hypothetical protein
MITRRGVFGLPLASLLGASTSKPKVACILNAWFPNSHADVFMSRLLDGYRLNGEWHSPRLEVASLFVDQFPYNDQSREQAAEYRIAIHPSIAEALRLGGKSMAVDAVAIIGEHGQYPRNARGNFMYPRWKHFDQVSSAMRLDGKVVPTYHDKYFASEWADALQLYRRVRDLHIPLMAGSTVPLTWRRPPLELAPGIELDEVVAVSFGDLEEHAYHAVEMVQSMVERRKNGETGVAAVRCVEGPAVWTLDFSRDLLAAALERRVNPQPDDPAQSPQAFQIRYRDGLKATILNLNDRARDYLFAARLKGRPEPLSTCFYIQLYNHNHWSFMVRNFENLVLTGAEPNPVERTLLSTGITIFSLESRRQGQKWLDTPELAIRY